MAALDRIKRHLEAFVEATLGRRLRYAFAYPGTVVVQAAPPSNAVDVLLDDPRMRGTGHQAITVRHGMPGVLARVMTGQRVMLAFAAGDPGQPFILAYDEGSATTDQLDINAQTLINVGGAGGTMRRAARESDTVRAGELLLSQPGGPGTPITGIYTDDQGNPPVVWTLTAAPAAALTLAPATPPPVTMLLRGYIDSGSNKVYEED